MYSVLHVGDRLGLKLLGRACGIAMIRIRSFGVESDSELRNVPKGEGGAICIACHVCILLLRGGGGRCGLRPAICEQGATCVCDK